MIELLNKIHHADWLTNNLPDKSVQLIIADPPYFEVKGDFDFIWKSFDDYLKDVEKWAIECKRILANNGTLFWYGNSKKIAYTQIILDKYFNLENSLVWRKKDSIQYQYYSPDLARTFNTHNERLLMYSNDADNFFIQEQRDYLLSEFRLSGKPIDFYKKLCGFTGNQPYNWFAPNNNGNGTWQLPTKEHYLKLQTTGYFKKRYEDLLEEYELKRRFFYNPSKYEEVLEFSQEGHKTKNYDHDTCKPETLTRALILTCSRPDDIVFVPFAGSGTEVAMAIKDGRKAIGYDIEKKYVDMANRRVDIINAQPPLFCFA
jgi:site-specific DNA-methyltransferase (adenine-specific)